MVLGTRKSKVKKDEYKMFPTDSSPLPETSQRQKAERLDSKKQHGRVQTFILTHSHNRPISEMA